jgi:hypothetical protein
VIHPRHTEVRRAPLKWHVLDVLGQHERSGLEHEDSAAARCIVDEKMLCHDRAKRAAADDDYVEVALSSGAVSSAIPCKRLLPARARSSASDRGDAHIGYHFDRKGGAEWAPALSPAISKANSPSATVIRSLGFLSDRRPR